ncbi:hypothetical protein ACI4A9_28550, partial [Klebsiella pneumoniae]|uniref:hypothetical protein n=1 Tax=Klebsiella pneumoniae TaxID=573 RepID=UPI003854603E
SMLNVSATQELARKLKAAEKANEELKAENTKLEITINELKTGKADASTVESLKAEIELLKAAISTTVK